MRRTPEERFWRKVDRRGDSECWEWRVRTADRVQDDGMTQHVGDIVGPPRDLDMHMLELQRVGALISGVWHVAVATWSDRALLRCRRYSGSNEKRYAAAAICDGFATESAIANRNQREDYCRECWMHPA